MSPLNTDKYLAKLREAKLKHAVESVTRPTEVTEKNFSMICGFQSGLNFAENLVKEVLTAEEKAFE